MRVLAVCVPAPGHVNPLLPLLTALAAQGDEVLVASGDDARAAVTRAGLGHRTAGAGFPSWFGALAGRIRGNPGDGLPPERIEAYFVPRLFAEIAAADMIEAVLDTGRAFDPDVVLFEPSAFAGPLAAAVLGRPGVQHQVSFQSSPEVHALAADAVTPLWRNFGQEFDRGRSLYGAAALRISPASIETWPTLPVDVLELRPTGLPVAAPAARGDRPLVHATLGTMINQVDTSVYRCIVDALADEPVDVVLALGAEGDPAIVGEVPRHVRVERYVPYPELLPQCAAVVSHGGSGTMYACLAHALPQVVVPQAADQFSNADVLEQAGLAIVLRPADVTPATVRDAVRAALSDEGYRQRATGVAAEIAAMPDAATVAGRLRERFG